MGNESGFGAWFKDDMDPEMLSSDPLQQAEAKMNRIGDLYITGNGYFGNRQLTAFLDVNGDAGNRLPAQQLLAVGNDMRDISIHQNSAVRPGGGQ